MDQKPSDSLRWQAGYLEKHAAEQSKYLEAVAASAFLAQTAENAYALLNLKLGQHVIEVGCGSGVFLPGLANRIGSEGRVTAIDHSPALVDEAQKRMAGSTTKVSVQVADAYKLPFPTGSFDAAHCERVLMHLEDPSAAVREMARVVRPGGIVVAAEPDWIGIRFDHPDPEAFELVYRRALRFKQSDVGITLLRRFNEVGLVDRRFMPVTSVFTDFAAARMFGLQLETAVQELVAEGAMPQHRLAAVVPALDAASANHSFYSIATMHVVSGVVARGG